EEHPDLFWALRGGGGNFGVATAFQLRLEPVGSAIFGGGLVMGATPELVRGYLDYALQAPDELTTILMLLKAPPLPFVPAEEVGQLVAVVAVCYVGDAEAGQRAVAPLRALGPTIADLTGPMPYPRQFDL